MLQILKDNAKTIPVLMQAVLGEKPAIQVEV